MENRIYNIFLKCDRINMFLGDFFGHRNLSFKITYEAKKITSIATYHEISVETIFLVNEKYQVEI